MQNYTVYFASRRVGVLAIEAQGTDRDAALAVAKVEAGKLADINVAKLTPLAVEPVAV